MVQQSSIYVRSAHDDDLAAIVQLVQRQSTRLMNDDILPFALGDGLYTGEHLRHQLREGHALVAVNQRDDVRGYAILESPLGPGASGSPPNASPRDADGQRAQVPAPQRARTRAAGTSRVAGTAGRRSRSNSSSCASQARC